jgi:TolB-like protein
MRTSETIRDKAQILVLSTFCLLNPFAGWAYLAEARRERWMKPPSISDRLKPTRLAVLPLSAESWGPGDGWAVGFEVDFADCDRLEVVPLARTFASLDAERDVLALGRSVGADFVLDAQSLVEEEGLRMYLRLIRVSDDSVRWSELLFAEPGDWPYVRDRVRCGILLSI